MPAGLSNAKVAYVCDLATQVSAGTVHLECARHLDDEAVIEELTKVKGIGRWTAEMFLMFRLHRPDVFPIDDLGIVNAIVRAYRLRKRPAPARLHKIAEPWRPYRSVACWYLWASLDTVTPGKKRRDGVDQLPTANSQLPNLTATPRALSRGPSERAR